MAEGLTEWRLHVGAIFPTPVPPRPIREWYGVIRVSDGAQGLPRSAEQARWHLHSLRGVGQHAQHRTAGAGPR
jgi:hypothetical protein